MTLLLAIDPSTRTGWARGMVGSEPQLGTANFKHPTHAEIFAHALDWIERQNYDALIIEEPIPPSQKWGATNFGTTQITLGLNAIFLANAKRRGALLRSVSIRTWRAYSLQSGKLNRAQAKTAAIRLCKMLKWPAADDNAAEAAGIFLYGCSQFDPRLAQRVEPLFLGLP